ncbi:MAG: hypothetical protein KTR15_12220 [Phycisphaeraceae bacterium]|nr:hypothetical protein [Phycisphaeraceae bacterium]
MSEPSTNHDALPLLEALLDGTIDESRFARLEAILLEDAAARALYRSRANLHAVLPSMVGQAPRLTVQLTDGVEDTLLEPHEMPHDQLMNLITQIESSGEDLDPMALATERFPAPPSKNPSRQQVFSALTYVYQHAVTPKRVAALATAAALLLGVVLLIVLLPGDDAADLAGVPGVPDFTPTTPGPDPNRVVATITEQHHAVWMTRNGEGALPDRTLLGPNRRLTLAQGFAQITTVRGAAVLVQAPVTIETTDSPNAIRLHRGKLVGRCETARSKGFIVHAPGMDVVDLGTEFGVEADPAEGSTVLVMQGSVRAQPTERSPLAFEPVVLGKNQARRVEPETGSLEMIAVSEAPVFYEDAPHPYVAAVLSAQPVAYWRFEDDADKTVANEIEPGRDDLSMVGPAMLTDAGVIGKAGRLVNQDAPFGYFETIGPIESLSQQAVNTVELWYYTDQAYTIESSVATLLSRSHPAREEQGLAIQLENDERLPGRVSPIGWKPNAIRVTPAFINDGPTPRELYTAKTYSVRQWQHLVLVNDRQRTRLYLDGMLVEDIPYAIQAISKIKLRLGLSNGDLIHGPEFRTDLSIMRPLRGRLDEVAIYDKPLTAEQVARHYELATGEEPSP